MKTTKRVNERLNAACTKKNKCIIRMMDLEAEPEFRTKYMEESRRLGREVREANIEIEVLTWVLDSTEGLGSSRKVKL